MTGLIVTTAVIALAAAVVIAVTEWIAGNDDRINAHTHAALSVTPEQMRDRSEGRARWGEGRG